AARSDRKRRARTTRAAIDQAVTNDRHRNRLRHIAFDGPQDFPAVRIVCINRATAAHDDLDLAADLDCDRRTPARTRAPILAPKLATRLLVQCDDKSLRRIYRSIATEDHLILVQNDSILVENRRSSRAVIEVYLTEALMPDDFSGKVDGYNTRIAKVGID